MGKLELLVDEHRLVGPEGNEIFKGEINKCYMKLQRVQGQSFDYALKYGGYKIEPTGEKCENPKKEAIFIRKDLNNAFVSLNDKVYFISGNAIYGTLGLLEKGDTIIVDKDYLIEKK